MTQHFKPSEFACKCGCGQTTENSELYAVLELVRIHYGKPVTINSSFRCHEHNEKVGGAPTSQHMLGTAADIKVKGINARKVTLFLRDTFPESYGIGDYKAFTHVDVRRNKARWSK